MNSSLLEESRKSIRANQYLARLSVLAFLFLPLTFMNGIFGMNFREFGQGNLSILRTFDSCDVVWHAFVLLEPSCTNLLEMAQILSTQMIDGRYTGMFE